MTTFELSENDVSKIYQRITKSTTLGENSCQIWNGPSKTLRIMIQCDEGKRNINVRSFIWNKSGKQQFDRRMHIEMKCGSKNCVEVEHMCLKRNRERISGEEQAERILSHTVRNPKGCFISKSKPDKTGYISSTLGGKTMMAHRVIYMMKNNDGKTIPSEKEGERLVIRHTCDTRSCVNPDHLKLGTVRENNHDDRIAAGTVLNGNKHPNQKIGEKLALQIKHSKRKKGDVDYMTQEERAKMFNVSKYIVSNIDGSYSWNYLPNSDGIIANNDAQRLKLRKRRRLNQQTGWCAKDTNIAMKKIRKNIEESHEGKSGDNPESFCWIWKKNRSNSGYGRTSFKGCEVLSHVLSCEAKYGRKKLNDEVVRHLCNNKICCNPEHLLFGSREQNVNDVVRHGVSLGFKLKSENVREIRESDGTTTELAEKYGVSYACIWAVRCGKSWKDV